jgi:hypothetical protein
VRLVYCTHIHGAIWPFRTVRSQSWPKRRSVP